MGRRRPAKSGFFFSTVIQVVDEYGDVSFIPIFSTRIVTWFLGPMNSPHAASSRTSTWTRVSNLNGTSDRCVVSFSFLLIKGTYRCLDVYYYDPKDIMVLIDDARTIFSQQRNIFDHVRLMQLNSCQDFVWTRWWCSCWGPIFSPICSYSHF